MPSRADVSVFDALDRPATYLEVVRATGLRPLAAHSVLTAFRMLGAVEVVSLDGSLGNTYWYRLPVTLRPHSDPGGLDGHGAETRTGNAAYRSDR